MFCKDCFYLTQLWNHLWIVLSSSKNLDLTIPSFQIIYCTFFYFPSHPFKSVALVGAQLATQYGEAAEEKKFRELITDAEWGIQLGKFGVSLIFIYYYFRILITDEKSRHSDI